MALIFEQFLYPDIGDAAYLVGDDAARVAAVVDPQRDVERYVERAREHGVAITHVFQTHVHEDFVSGAVALAAAAGGAEVCVGGDGAEPYAHPHRGVRDGENFELGQTRLTVRHTPGHTPEHIALLVAQADADDDGADAPPFAVLSGGALLVGSAGRSDLLGPDRAEELAAAQFRSLRDVFLALPDGVQVWPTHVHGSPCGAAIGDRTSTAIGWERTHNPLLEHADEAAFVAAALADLPPRPRHYPRIKRRNQNAPPPDGALPAVRALPPRAFAEALAGGGHALVDTRTMAAFGGGHIAGALNIGAAGHLAIWAGWMLDADREILLVVDSDAGLPDVLRALARTGFDRYAGSLAGGIKAWAGAGLPLQTLPQWDVHRLDDARRADAALILDVRAPHEWAAGHVPGARHVFLPELPAAAGELPRDRPIAVYCGSGYRASIAASWLRGRGHDAAAVPGSFKAWKACGLPVDKANEAAKTAAG